MRPPRSVPGITDCGVPGIKPLVYGSHLCHFYPSREELIEGLSFPVYRRVATMIFVPAQRGAIEMVTIDPAELQAARERDASAAGEIAPR